MKKILITLMGIIIAAVSSFAFAQSAIEEPEIAGILATVNKGEIKAASKAQAKASNPDVRRFAQLMITDHQNANQSAMTVFKAAKIRPFPSMYSKNLKKENNMAMRKMKKLQGAAFDQTYMDSQVMMHQNVLNLIDSTLLPNAQTPEVKTLLTNVRGIIAGHLQQAQQIRGAL